MRAWARTDSPQAVRATTRALIQNPLKNWAEESYAVAQVILDTQSSNSKAYVWELLDTAQDGLICEDYLLETRLTEDWWQ
ncbi:uncharacterized protein N7459_005538 [Penicillium hispanicum]|uniref:uncharacterized protein n=1 Tax=Penicillium hispanicum TaxID=1080232 RepID=UPI00253F6D87|nr:uncharacterized protein N7459_005538 [Penicillium hispanicum]KAJ5579553.1 hypothetical protein N7459_005538 [Penicillium hispanicum]